MKRKVKVINRDVAVFAFFLLLSFSLWYLNSLGEEIESGIRYPVIYTNLPNKRIISGNYPDKLNLYLKGPGYSILKLKVSGNKSPLIIDLSKVIYKRIPDSKTPEYYIISSGLMKSLTVQLRSGCEVTSVKPDTIFFTLGSATEGSLKGKSGRGSVITGTKGS